MKIHQPEDQKDSVDRRIQDKGYGSSSEHMRELIRRDRGRLQFRQHLTDGIESGPVGRMNKAYFDDLRRRIRKSTTSKP